MKISTLLIVCLVLFFACNEQKEISSINPENWSKRTANLNTKDSLEYGKSYLSIYSQIYSRSERRINNITAMVSLRNTSVSDTLYILKAEYYGTSGKSVRKYFNQPIYLAPLETIDLIIDESDISGGTGSNFIFEWKIPKNASEPLFEGVMNSSIGHFITQGIRIK